MRRDTRHPRGESSVDTLRPSSRIREIADMDTSASDGAARQPLADGHPNIVPDKAEDLRPSTPTKAAAGPNVEAKLPATPTRKVDKPLPKEPAKTPRTKKKVPWKGKNILVLLPRDDERGLPGKPPKPLRQSDIDKMFASWEELGYSTNGFDHVVEGYQPPGTDDSQSRDAWPTSEDLVRERSERTYKVTLPDLNGEPRPNPSHFTTVPLPG